MSNILKCITGPRLFKTFKNDIDTTPGKLYVANALETIGDMVVKWFRFCWSFSYWGSPVIIPIMYRKGAFTASGMATCTSYATSIGIILVMAIFIRALGRFTNSNYQKFLTVLAAAHKNYNPVTKKQLEKYDFEFRSWPVDFVALDKQSNDKKGRSWMRSTSVSSSSTRENLDGFSMLKSMPSHILSYVAAHTFGIRMVYPGQTALINTLVGPALQMGRSKLIEDKKGLRAKIKTEDGNEIDTCFIDRRNSMNTMNGNILVVCCEGNSGFYEIGCTVTPLDAGYSVLGWNHPGFWGSSGTPYPSQEQCAIDGVMQYAITKLGFQPQDIVLFAWSIGGYTASWAAMNYPEIRHVILDATFDDILPLAVARMPKSLESIVNIAIRKYVNLNIAEQLLKYPGPILFIRRSKDEMITTVDPTVIESNRGNDLLMKLLLHRYPNIVDVETKPLVKEYLSKLPSEQGVYLTSHDVDNSYCVSLLRSYVEDNSSSFPLQFSPEKRDDKVQLALYLAYQHLHDFDATHCIPLPAAFFKKPWSI